MKTYNTIYTLILLTLLTACGQNDISDTNKAKLTNKIAANLQTILIDKHNGNIVTSIALTRTASNHVDTELSNMSIRFGDCKLKQGSVSANPSIATLDNNTSSKTINFVATLESKECEIESYQVLGSMRLEVRGIEKTELFITKSQSIVSALIKEGTLVSELTVMDPENKRLDVNESKVEKSVKLHLSQGVIGLSKKNITITTGLDKQFDGHFYKRTLETDENGNANFVYIAPEEIPEKEFSVQFCEEDDPANCDTLHINLADGPINGVDKNKTNNDSIRFEAKDGSMNLSMDEKKLYTVTFLDKQDKSPVEDKYIKSITIESLDVGTISLVNRTDVEEVSELEIKNKNNVSFYLKGAKHKSGTSDIKIKVEYKTPKDYVRTEFAQYSVTVLSGEAVNFEVVSSGVKYNASEKVFENKFTISATDRENVKVNRKTPLNISVMAGYAKDSNGSFMVYGKEKNTQGIYANLSSGASTTLNTFGVAAFKEFDNASRQGVNIDTDFAVIFGTVPLTPVVGKWDIDSITTNDALAVSRDSNNTSKEFTGAGFAIGHSYRENVCSSTYEHYLVEIDGKHVLDENGKTFITLKYPAEYMPGKQIALAINVSEPGSQTNGGDVKFITLGVPNGLTETEETIPAGKTETIRHFAKIATDGNETLPVTNSLFSCESSGDSAIVDIKLVNQNNATDCSPAFVEYEVTASPKNEGKFTLSNCQFKQEFKY